MIMAAGTGGHIFPGLSVAQEMQKRGWDVSWLGTKNGMERSLVAKNGIEFHALDFHGVRGKGIKHALTGACQLVQAAQRSRSIMAATCVDLVLGMGGYVTVPGAFAAKSLNRPVAVMNADAGLLLSNRILAPISDLIMLGLPSCGAQLKNAVVTGNSVRPEVTALPPPQVRMDGRTGALRVLVVGGSLGAQVLNRIVPEAVGGLYGESRPVVVHQVGMGNIDSVRSDYRKRGVTAHVTEFIDDMAKAYAEADIVICRAGAMTISELTAAGVASILVPLEASTTSHQVANAEWMASNQASVHLPQAELTADSLRGVLDRLVRYDCFQMAKKARQLGCPAAVADIAARLEGLTG